MLSSKTTTILLWIFICIVICVAVAAEIKWQYRGFVYTLALCVGVLSIIYNEDTSTKK